MSGVWTSPTEFKSFDTAALTGEIASRSRAQGVIDIGLLPDPDEVLKKLGKAIPVYRSLLTDSHVWSTVQSRKSGVLSAEWGVEPADEGSNKGAGEKAAEICDLALSRLDVYQLISEILDAVLYGLTPVELVWEHAHGCWLPARAEAKPAEWFKYNSENELRFVSADDEESGEALPDKKFIIARHHATYANPYGERTLSRCFWPVAFKRGGFKFWATFSEKYGMPFLVGKVPRGTATPDREKLLASLGQMVQDAVAVINNDESIEIMEASGKAASADVYEKLIQTSNREVSKAVLGQTLTTEIDRGGSYAATKEHMEVRGDLVDQDKRMAANAMNTLLAWITALNAESAEPPVFRFFEDENLQADRAERDDRLVDQGVSFTKEYYQRIYNLQEDDFDLADADAGANRQKFSSFPRRSPRSRRGRWFPVGSGLRPEPTHGPTGGDNFIEFAEGRQAEVDALADNAAREAQPFIDSWIAAVKKHLTDAKNLRSAGETIADLYTHDSRFAEALADALLAADRVGVDSVDAELGAGQDFARRHGNADLRDAGQDFARRQKLSSFSRRSPRPVRGRWFPVGSGLRPEPTHGPTGGDNFIEFAEAQWGPGKPFEDAVAFFKARSFTIAGVANADLLGDVRSEIIRAMEEGRTLKDFRADVDAVFDRRGWTRLKPHRVRTIFQTNIQGAYQAARHRQMTSPAVTAARPYWRYVSIDDAVTRPEHRALHGKIFRHDHPFWATWYPPNGYNCFPAGTLIRTKRGDVPIEKVSSGDNILTHKGRYRMATHTHKSHHTGDLVKITGDDGTVLELTPNHRVLTPRGWVAAEQLTEKDRILKAYIGSHCYIPKSVLVDLYCARQMPLRKIAKVLDINFRTVLRKFKAYEIPKRTQSESVALQWDRNRFRKRNQSEYAYKKLAGKRRKTGRYLKCPTCKCRFYAQKNEVARGRRYCSVDCAAEDGAYNSAGFKNRALSF